MTKEELKAKYGEENVQEFFQFLNELRRSAAVNMFSSAGRLAIEFNLSRKQAGEVLLCWMDSFTEEDL